MIGAIIKIVIGWFLIDKVPGIVGAKGLFCTVIKVVGVLVLISGFVGLAHCILYF